MTTSTTSTSSSTSAATATALLPFTPETMPPPTSRPSPSTAVPWPTCSASRPAGVGGCRGPDRGLPGDTAGAPGAATGRQGQQASDHADHCPGAPGPRGLQRRPDHRTVHPSPQYGEPIDRRDVYRMVRRIATTAKIPGHISPHSLRPAAITNARDAGVPLWDAQILARYAAPVPPGTTTAPPPTIMRRCTRDRCVKSARLFGGSFGPGSARFSGQVERLWPGWPVSLVPRSPPLAACMRDRWRTGGCSRRNGRMSNLALRPR
jgi:hypothetical protein